MPGETFEKTKAPARIVKGHAFHAYKVGMGEYVRHCEALDATVKPLGKDTYAAVLRGAEIISPRTRKPQRFRSQHAAMKALIAEASQPEAPAR